MPDHPKLKDDTIAHQNVHSEAIKEFLASLLDIHDISDVDLNRYELAFTHRSIGGEDSSYERLEFLGDRVLNLIVARYLFDKPDRLLPGEMTKKMECVNNDNLEEFIEKKSFFPEKIIQNGTPLTPKIRADMFEALIGAIYLHTGCETAKNVILSIFKDEIEDFDPDKNYKGRLQEECQSRGLPLPTYKQDLKEGPDHDPTFHYSVKIGTMEMGKGTGNKIIEAQQEAARRALIKLRTIP